MIRHYGRRIQPADAVHLAAQLGVSRTPLREALGRLTAEGAVEARPRFGYFVRPLTVAEFAGAGTIISAVTATKAEISPAFAARSMRTPE